MKELKLHTKNEWNGQYWGGIIPNRLWQFPHSRTSGDRSSSKVLKGCPGKKATLLSIIIHSKYLFGLSYMTDTVVGARDTAVNNTRATLLSAAHILVKLK